MADQKQETLSAEACYEYVYHKVFPLRPADYCTKYPKWPGLVGLEVEMLPLWTRTLNQKKPETVHLFDEGGLVPALESLKASQSLWQYNYQPDDPTHLLTISLDDSDMISFEPGGQLEFSTRPYPCLSEAIQRMQSIQGILDQALAQKGISIIQVGMNPWLTVDEIGLQMTKPRYRAMDAFFTSQNEFGRRMMRQTCTIQVNLDFGGNDEVLAKRYLLANLLAPFATAMFANSPFLDGQANEYLSNRARVWQHMDDSRTGFPHLEGVVKSMNRKACVDTYYDFIMNGRVVFAEPLHYRVMDGRFRFKDWVEHGIDGVKPTMKELQTHLSLQFPEVRARGFMELRSIDCQHRFWQVAPAAFCVAMLYNDTALHAGLDLLLPLRNRLIEYWKYSIHGLKNPDMAQMAQKIMRIARDAFGGLPPCFQGANTSRIFEAYAAYYTDRARTPAEDLLEIHASEGGLTGTSFGRMTERWQKFLDSQ
ncbi:glutamate-cysteine ligase family protein [Oligoflexus tunisiensis]|uniref:glutamate-cysteine ligase family protein n=1 Tax=Oligoflexus tunisiensis TaxID=708132 RepID=UPI000B0B4EE6|nr:glutamate-cysteine ligase family protein [Oligoflexus tunisiensis]